MKRCCFVMSLVLLCVGMPGRAGWWSRWFVDRDSSLQSLSALAVPTLLSPQDGATFSLEEPIVLRWTSVSDATGYYYEVNGAGSGESILATQVNLPLNPYAVGRFDWRVQAWGNHEIGPWSETWTFYRQNAVTPTPTPFGTPLPDLDVDGNGRVDYRDSFTFLSEWRQTNATHDFTGEGLLDQQDVLLYLTGWKSPGRLFPLPTPALPAPQLLEPLNGAEIDFWDIHEFDPREGRDNGVWFRWTAVAEANWYELRIQGPAGWSNVGDYIESGITTTEFKVTLPLRLDNPKDLGLYRWQVRGFSTAQGGMGAYSDPFTFVVEYIGTLPTPTPTPIPRSADLDQDSRVTIEDIFTFALAWGISEASQPQQYSALETADLDRSGWVGPDDLYLFLRSYHRRLEETLTAPLLLSPADGARVPYLQAIAADFQWTFEARPGAALYEYEILQPPPLVPIKRGFINDTGKAEYNLRTLMTPALKGEWQWRVRAYGPSGRISLWSPRWSFRVE